MRSALGADTLSRRLDEALAERTEANRAFFEAEAERLARLCHLMAERFARGGRLIAFGRTPAARSDTRHIAVEFVHPVIVGKRALPALGLAAEGGGLERQVDLALEPDDIAIAFGDAARWPRRWPSHAGAAASRSRSRPAARSGSSCRPPATRPCARSWWKRSTTCSGSWCTCSSSTAGCSRAARRGGCTTPAPRASSIPSWPRPSTTSTPVLEDVRRSVLAKAEEIGELRAQTLEREPAGARRGRRRAATVI